MPFYKVDAVIWSEVPDSDVVDSAVSEVLWEHFDVKACDVEHLREP